MINKLNLWNSLREINGFVAFGLYIINIIVCIKYIEIYNNFEKTGIVDLSIPLVPLLCVIASFLLFTTNTYLNKFHKSGVAGIFGSVVCILIILLTVPLLGEHFDITGIALIYWNIMSKIIYWFLAYLLTYKFISILINIIYSGENNER